MNSAEWDKQIKRITKLIAKHTTIEFTPPPKPKRVTEKALQKLKSITPKTIKQALAQEVPNAPARPPRIEIETKTKRVAKPEEHGTGYHVIYLSPEQRSAAARKAAETRKRKGIEPFGGKRGTGGHGKPPTLTPEQRSAAARKAAQTRKAKGIKPFANLTPEQRSAAAKKAAETRKARGIKPFANLTMAQRSAAAKKAAETRKEKGIIPFKKKEVMTTPVDGVSMKVDLETGEAEPVKVTPSKKRTTAEPKEEPQEDEEPVFEIPDIDEDEYEIPEADWANIIVANFKSEVLDLLSQHPNARYLNYILKSIVDMQSTYGIDEVALALMKAKDEGVIISMEVMYNINGAGAKYLYMLTGYLSEGGNLDEDMARKIDDELNDIEDEWAFSYGGGIEDEEDEVRKWRWSRTN